MLKKEIAAFGVAGNFTGHLEQAGEAKDFFNVKAKEGAPKALFPTYIPLFKEIENPAEKNCPDFLHTFPFDSKKIIFPKGEEKLQLEAECAILFRAEWNKEKIISLKPLSFGASNDCSIRKEGAKKISLKKNWGPSSKGISENLIPLDSFSKDGILSRYRIASFLKRQNGVFVYGEDSAVRDYSYIFETLEKWLLEKLNGQCDEGPAENIHSYLKEADCPEEILISIGATRYTEFGQNNFLQKGDHSVIVLYPEEKYKAEEIFSLVKNCDCSDKELSILDQEIIV